MPYSQRGYHLIAMGYIKCNLENYKKVRALCECVRSAQSPESIIPIGFVYFYFFLHAFPASQYSCILLLYAIQKKYIELSTIKQIN